MRRPGKRRIETLRVILLIGHNIDQITTLLDGTRFARQPTFSFSFADGDAVRNRDYPRKSGSAAPFCRELRHVPFLLFPERLAHIVFGVSVSMGKTGRFQQSVVSRPRECDCSHGRFDTFYDQPLDLSDSKNCSRSATNGSSSVLPAVSFSASTWVPNYAPFSKFPKAVSSCSSPDLALNLCNQLDILSQPLNATQ